MGAAKKLRKPNIRLVGIRNLVLDESIQSRICLDKEWAHQLSEFRKDGAEFPPIGVIQTPDGRFVVWSGFHRVEASRLAGDQQIRCEVEQGTERDARIKSAGSNKSNGVKPMGAKDNKKAARLLFEDEEWLQRSAVVIGEYIGCSSAAITRWRAAFCTETGIAIPERIIGADGNPRRSRKNALKEGRLPLFQKTKRPGYVVFVVNGRKYETKKEQAESRRAEAVAESMKEIAKKTRSLEASSLIDFLSCEGFQFRYEGSKGRGIGNHIISDSHIVVPGLSEFSSALSLLPFIATAALARHKYGGAFRIVVVCYGPPQSEALDIARDKMSIEFLTPEELAKSLKGTEETP